MKPSESIKPISFLKTHTADVVREVKTQETLALLKLLAQGKRSIEESRSRPFRKAIKELRAELAEPQG